MLKKWILWLVVLVTAVSVGSAAAETAASEQQELLDEYIEELKESSRIFTVPLNIGPIYSVIVRKDGIGIVFSMIRSKSLSYGLEAVSFVMDLEEMDISLLNGNVYTIPAIVQLQSSDVGAFMILNLSGASAKALIEMANQNSPVVKFTFIQSDGNRIEMSVEEFNRALSDATGQTADIVNQAGTAILKFGNSLASGIGSYAEDAYSSVEKALVDAGDTLAGAAKDVGAAVRDAGSSVGEFLEDASGSVGEFLGDASEAAAESLNDAMESVGSIWNGLWGK